MKSTDHNVHDNSEDITVIDACLRGNRPAFENLVKKYQSNVMALSINILGCSDDAMDMVQETFTQAYINLEKFDRERKFKTWILSIAAKRCLDHIKKKKSFFRFFSLKTSESPHETFYQDVPFKYLEESDVFFPLLKKLSEKERIAILLKINENYTASEIAGVLSCSENTARVHFHNGKQKLKKLLKTADLKTNPNMNIREVFK